MKQKFSIFRNEDGSTVVLTVLILVALTLTGISAITTSTIEIQIAANDKRYKTAFHNADSGVFALPTLISRTMDEQLTPGDISGTDKRYDAFTYLDPGANDDGSSGSTFFREVVGHAAGDNNNDIEFVLNDNAINVDIQRGPEGTVATPGAGIEFLSGYEGAGTGTASAGSHTLYFIDSVGSAGGNTVSNTRAVYRYVTGIAGGT